MFGPWLTVGPLTAAMQTEPEPLDEIIGVEAVPPKMKLPDPDRES